MAKQRLRGTYVFPAGGASQANVDKTISEATEEIKSVVYKSVAGLEVESNKTASVTANGTLVVEPSDGKDAMEKATVTVAVPLEVNKTATIDASQYAAPVEITPSDGKTAMQKATVTVTNIPVLEANKTATITQNGTHAINPSSGKDGMEKATITVNVSGGGADLEDNKTATIDVSAYTDPVEITPTAGKDGMKKATVTLDNIPSGGDVESNKAVTIDVSLYTTPIEVTPTAGKDSMAKATVTLSNIPSGGGATAYAWTNQTNIYIIYLNIPVATETKVGIKTVFADPSNGTLFVQNFPPADGDVYAKISDTEFTISYEDGEQIITDTFIRDSTKDVTLW